MKPTTEPLHLAQGLTYRVRRGQPQHALIVLLHGLSGDENAMWIFDHALPRSATVVAPRALYASEFGGYSWARSVVRDDRASLDFQAALDVLPRFIDEVSALTTADPQRVIVLGFSQGAALSYAVSLVRPHLLRGVIALAGFLPHPARSHAVAESKDALPHYLILHGTRDEAVPVDRAREARSVLEERGAAVEYHEHAVGHKVSTQGMQEIKRWIRQVLE